MLSIVSLFAATALLQCITSGHIIKDTKREIENQVKHAPARRVFHKFVRVPDPLRVTRTSSGVLVTCEAVGNPAPSVLWMKNGQPIADYEEVTNEIRSTSPDSVANVTSRLVTSAVTGDVFTCLAVAGVKEASRSEMYDEGGDYDTLAPGPIITEFYNTIFQNIGLSVTLPCRVSSSSQYELVWLVNDKDVYENPRLRVLPSGDLRINNLVWDDMGNYSCTVRDIYGTTTESTFLYPMAVNNN